MTVEAPVQPDLEKAVEAAAEEAIATAEKLPVEGAEGGEEKSDREFEGQRLRIAMTCAATTIAAGVMVGGIFVGIAPRLYAIVAGLIGIVLADRAQRARSPYVMYAWTAGGIFVVGLLLVVPSGAGNIPKLSFLIKQAMSQGSLLHPPVIFQPGWHAVVGWMMACVGFVSGWIALQMKRPAFGLMIPMPVVAFAAISVAKSQQLVSGLVAMVLLAIGLGLLSSLHERGTDDEKPSVAYELRRALRAGPVIAVVITALYFLSKSHILFPAPAINPAQEARKPKSIPISEVKDRVLFEVKADFTGPWKLGTLDVYDGHDWRLPPYNPDLLTKVPPSGLVDSSLPPAVKAQFTARGITGAVLPGLANTVGLIADIPNDMELSYDKRAGVVRVTQGELRAGFQWTIVSATIPTVQQLRSITGPVPGEMKQWLQIPDAPQAVKDLLAKAPTGDLWDRLDFVRHNLLKIVRASGAGVPVSITPQRVGEMLTTNPTATPFEIVAAEAMLARWAGVPSRIGYGFDGGEPGPTKGTLEIRPKNGSLYLEVYFNGKGWLPIIGDPLQAKIDLNNAQQQTNPGVLASDNISIQLVIPELEPPSGELFRVVRSVLGAVLPALALIFLIYILWPLPYKIARRARRRTWANSRGPAARVALAYAEWRDAVTDYGYPYASDTPLMFLQRLTPDDEHTELAWLVTRALWGDMNGFVSVDDAVAAEEMAGALRQRLSRAHPWTLRTVSALSRLSIRDPYAPALGIQAKRKKAERSVLDKEVVPDAV